MLSADELCVGRISTPATIILQRTPCMIRKISLPTLAAIAGTIGWSTMVDAASVKPCRTQACIDQRAAAQAAAQAAAAAAARKAAHDKKAAALKAAAEKRAAAEQKRKMDAEIAAEKALIAKRAAEPKIIKQTCQMVNGQLVCK